MSSTYQRITADIIKAIEATGGESLPWRKLWHCPAPCNAETGRQYRGLNRVVLDSKQDFKDHRWLTFPQALKLGGSVRKGEKSTAVLLWKESLKDDEHERRLLCRTFNLFNLEQVDGVDQPSLFEAESKPSEPLHAAQAILNGYKDCPPIHFVGNVACYSPSRDEIRMPHPGRFVSMEGYFSTAYHEAVHSCGHPSRLDRFTIRNPQAKGTPQYAFEELIAELGSAFLCNEAGVLAEGHAAYLQSWLKCFRNDTTFLVRASSAAQRAADYILGRYTKPDFEEIKRHLEERKKELASV